MALESSDLLVVQKDADGALYSLKIGDLPSSTVPDATETEKGIIRIATDAEAAAGLDATTAITPATLKTAVDGVTIGAASETDAGIIRIATEAEVQAGVDDLTAVTPAKLQAVIDDLPDPPTPVDPTQTYTPAIDKGTLTLSPGDDATDLPAATITEAGLMTAADKVLLDDLVSNPRGVQSLLAGNGITINTAAPGTDATPEVIVKIYAETATDIDATTFVLSSNTQLLPDLPD